MARVGKISETLRDTSDLYATYEQILCLENSKLASEKFIYHIPDLILILDEKSRILKANRAAELVVGAKEGELINSHLGCFFSDLNWESFQKNLKKLAQSTSFEACVEFDLSTDGVDIRCREYHWKIIFLQGLKRRAGKLFTVIGHDITTIRKMYIEIRDSHTRLRDYSDELRKLVRVVEEQKSQILEGSKLAQLGEMAGGIAQEIDLPIETMHRDALSMKKIAGEGRIKEFQNELKNLSQNIMGTVDRIADVIKTMRILSRSGENEAREKIDIAVILNNILIYFKEKFRNRNINFSVEYNGNDFLIDCKMTQMSHVFINLLNNSFDAVSGLKNPWIKITVSKTSGHKVHIRVTDSGEGIPEKEIGLIFHPFYTTKTSGQSIGVGLTSCRNLLQEFDGKIWYDQESANTSFVIELPCCR